MHQGFVILDFGSQVSQLIARRLRELGYFSELIPARTNIEDIRAKKPFGIILSGGPNSVYDKGAPDADVRSLLDIAPVLGICYGMQLIAHKLGGIVAKSDHREYGNTWIEWNSQISKVPKEQKVWMSHGDVVQVPPAGFEIVALSKNGHPAAMQASKILALQFHPEVEHTEHGTELLKYFCENMCAAQANWKTKDVLSEIIAQIKTQVPKDEKVLCALSGGVDSTVVGRLLTEALGPDRVVCVFVDNGLLRKNEYQSVLDVYEQLGLNVKGINASQLFLDKLKGVSDPEAKRKIIGHLFIDVFKTEIKNHSGITHLAQGTLYPDVIESVSPLGESVTIKSHHNVGGLPKDLNLKLVEPLRELFKDEVRLIGEELKIPRNLLWRHPFPGPGLAIRCIGEVTEEALNILKDVDAIFIDELKRTELYSHIWQAFVVLLPIKTVGVQGDGRSYEKTVALRAVTSTDGMTADWFKFPYEFLASVSNRITNEVRGVNRVVYDITSKPPGTIEWE
jgi:GMP synthase (glutamine-hydrolysing)